MQPTNVLFVNTPQATGGAEISLLTAMINLDPASYRAHLVTTPGSMLIEQARNASIEPHLLDFPWLSRKWPWPFLKSICGLTRLIRVLNVSVVHTNCDYCLPYVQYACGLTRVPYISHVRDFVRSWFREPYLTALRGAARVIANSHAIADKCISQSIPPNNVVTIYNPIDIDRFQVGNDDLRAELGLSREALVIGIVGQIQEIKGYREFLSASLRVASLIPNAVFLCVGRAPDNAGRELEREMRLQIAASPHANAYYLIGYRNDIEAVMRTLDVLVVPSWSESFGRVAVEGMAAGKVVIGTNVGGLPEIITNEVDGLLIPPRNVGALCEALLRVLTDSTLRGGLGKAASISAQRFSIAQHIVSLQTLYNEVLR